MASSTKAVFRRGGLRLACWYAAAGVFWLFAGLIVLALGIALFPLRSWTFEKAWFVLLTAVLAVGAVRAAWNMRAWIRPFRASFLEIAEGGVRFRFGDSGEESLAWPEISGVTSEKCWVTPRPYWPFGYRLDRYTILSRRGAFVFTAMEIPRPARAAEAIAARLGAGLQRIG